MTNEQKRIRKMQKSYRDARKQIRTALAECRIGTAVHLQHIRALSDLDAQERSESIALGLEPANLGNAMRTEFLYVSFVSHCPANREELEELLKVQAVKATKGLNYSEQDETIRQQLGADFK